LYGVSYGGYYAAAAALSRHPAIVASSLQAPVMDFFFEDFHHNGALLEAHLGAFPVFGTARSAPTTKHWWLPEFGRVADFMAADYDSLLALGPLRNATTRLLPNDTWWRAVVSHPDYDTFWQTRSMPPRLRGITHPVLVVGGWFDAENLYGTLEAYRALRTRSPASAVSLVMGPFAHRGWAARDAPHTVHGDLYFGDSLATTFQRDVEAPFFRRHVKGVRDVARVDASMLFDTGRKTWARFARWPAPSAQTRSYFFRRDGSLAATPAAVPNAFVEYPSDPLNPVPARCTGPTIEDGALDHVMSDDQRCFTSRPDVAVFQTGTLQEDATFAGEITARLSVSTTGTDADFVVKVIDVYPADEPDNPHRRDTVRLGGYHQLVRGEIMRGRYRRSFSAPAPFRPHEITEVVIRLPDVFHTFRKGHRIMVQVQSTWFPLFDRNPQRYVRSIYAADGNDFVRTTQRIWVSPRAASRLDAQVLAEALR
jgi:putative CocE/NonD family hydrolase